MWGMPASSRAVTTVCRRLAALTGRRGERQAMPVGERVAQADPAECPGDLCVAVVGVAGLDAGGEHRRCFFRHLDSERQAPSGRHRSVDPELDGVSLWRGVGAAHGIRLREADRSARETQTPSRNSSWSAQPNTAKSRCHVDLHAESPDAVRPRPTVSSPWRQTQESCQGPGHLFCHEDDHRQGRSIGAAQTAARPGRSATRRGRGLRRRCRSAGRSHRRRRPGRTRGPSRRSALRGGDRRRRDPSAQRCRPEVRIRLPRRHQSVAVALVVGHVARSTGWFSPRGDEMPGQGHLPPSCSCSRSVGGSERHLVRAGVGIRRLQAVWRASRSVGVRRSVNSSSMAWRYVGSGPSHAGTRPVGVRTV